MKIKTKDLLALGLVTAVLAVAVCLMSATVSLAQAESRTRVPGFPKIGEKLSYNVSFENFQNVAVIEMQVVSAGKLRGLDAIELRGHAKTFSLVSAAFRLIDETRTTFISPDTGSPLFVDRTLNDGPLPKKVTVDLIKEPTAGYDLLSLIYKIRESGGNGSFTLIENGETFVVTALSSKSQSVTVQAGSYETIVSDISSTYLDSLGIKSMTMNLSTDGQDLPVLMTLRTQRGTYRAELANVQVDTPQSVPVPTPAPTLSPTPTARPTPVPKPTPTPYIDDQPLLPELSFELGETLDYRLTNKGQPAGSIRFRAVERKQFQGRDSLKLEFAVVSAGQGSQPFIPGDSAYVQADPETLAPYFFEINFKGPLNGLDQRVFFDQKNGRVSFDGARSVEAPVGTHSLLTLFYAMRSFNLRPSKDPANPVNDTRVAVFWEDAPYIFTLRPGATEDIMMGKDKVSAQVIAINTGLKQLDSLGIKVWLSNDARRLPVRISAGSYQADLESVTKSTP